MPTIRIRLFHIKDDFCPICKTIIRSHYKDLSGKVHINNKKFCPSCGFPIEIKPQAEENVKYCVACNASNPTDANYCRCCGENLRLEGKVYGKVHRHAWMDLGLSVLWSTETLGGPLGWMTHLPPRRSVTLDMPAIRFWDEFKREREKQGNIKHPTDEEFEEWVSGKYGKTDLASRRWGDKWRTPTREEFEELIVKCKWEKIIIGNGNRHALKVTGPNGNHIIIETTGNGNTDCIGGVAICSILCDCCFWTSTAADGSLFDDKLAYMFQCSGFQCSDFINFYSTKKDVKEKDLDKIHTMWLEDPIYRIQVTPEHVAFRKAHIRPVMDKE